MKIFVPVSIPFDEDLSVWYWCQILKKSFSLLKIQRDNNSFISNFGSRGHTGLQILERNF